MPPHPFPLLCLLSGEPQTPDLPARCNFVIGGGKLLWIGDAEAPLPSGLRDLGTEFHDLEGARVIPGLVDGHAHFTGGGGEAGFASRVPPLAKNAFVAAGITSAIGVLGTDDLIRTTAELLAVTRGLVEQGFGGWCMTGGYHFPPSTLCGSVRADLVHLDRVIGVGEFALSDHRSSQPTLDEFLRLASEAHVAALMTGKAGLLHLHMGDGGRGLDLVRAALDQSELPPSMFQPTHVNRRRALFEEALELAARGCPLDLTAFPVGDDEGPDGALAAADAVEAYLATGLAPSLLSVSSDGGGCLPHFDAQGRVDSFAVAQPGALTDCLVTLLERGHSLAEVLPFFSTYPAQRWRLPGKGRLAVGSDADLVVLGADHRPVAVLLGGTWQTADGHLAQPCPSPPSAPSSC